MPSRPARGGRARTAAWLAALSLVVAGAGCFGDLVRPGSSHTVYRFASPLRDTMMNVGDVTGTLPCDLTADDRPIPCALSVSVVAGTSAVTAWSGKLLAGALGTAIVEIRPLSVQLPSDSIVRRVTVRTVVPRMTWVDLGLGDTIAVGVMRIILALPATRSGALVPGAPITWVQDSGFAAAHLVPYLPGWIQADAPGVAVFRAVTDTASTPPRRITVVPAHAPAFP